MKNGMINSYFKISFGLSSLISFLIHFTSILDNFRKYLNHQIDFTFLFGNAISELFITFSILFVLYYVNFYILKPYKTVEKTKIKTVIISLIISFVIVSAISHLLFSLKNAVFVESKLNAINHYTFKDVIITIVVIASVQVIKIVHQNQIHTLEIQHLKIENLQKQYEVLKNQLSPHFLFNCLNSLKTLIRETPDLAQQYVNHLSNVLRYTLQANQNKVVTLEEEINLIKSYFFLLKLRYSQNLELEISNTEKFNRCLLPPLTLQILIENAVKHNEISKHKRLIIILRTTEEYTVIVKNNINPKLSDHEGTGLGLANLSAQYHLLKLPDIKINKSENNFSVEVHLIKP